MLSSQAAPQAQEVQQRHSHTPTLQFQGIAQQLCYAGANGGSEELALFHVFTNDSLPEIKQFHVMLRITFKGRWKVLEQTCNADHGTAQVTKEAARK